MRNKLNSLIRLFLGGITAIGLWVGAANAEVLDCSIMQYANPPYFKADLKGLLPSNQRHVLSGDEARWGDILGRVTRNDGDRIKWYYTAIVPQNAGLKAKVSFTLIPKNGILIVRVNPGGSSSDPQPYVARNFRFKVVAYIDSDGFWEQEILPVTRVGGVCAKRG